MKFVFHFVTTEHNYGFFHFSSYVTQF